MATIQEKSFTAPPSKIEPKNAEQVTSLALEFLKRLGNKRGLKPKRVTIEGKLYTVEIEMKKNRAIVQIDSVTEEIKEYEIQKKTEESGNLPLTPKTILFISGITAILHIALNWVWSFL